MPSIIIVNYNAGFHLRDCIQTLPPDSDIIIVDNASHDNSLSLVEALQHPNVRIIRNTTNLGFATACNIGAKASQADLLFFLNPDCRLEPNTIAELITALDSAPDIGMVGGLLLNPDGSEQAGGRRSVPTPWRSFTRAFGLSKLLPRYFKDFNLHQHPLPTAPLAVEAISGACMLMKKSTFEQLGGWDEAYFLHCEDLDLCMRYRGAGYRILFVPSARLTHDKGVCSQAQPLTVEWHKHRGMLRFYQKFFRHQYPGPFMWLVNLSVALRLSSIALYYSLKRVRTLIHEYRANQRRYQPNRTLPAASTLESRSHCTQSNASRAALPTKPSVANP